MAGNQAVFDAAMRRAQSYAFENQWDRALKEYQRALAEFPNDGQARTNYAQALYRLQQYPAALEEYVGLLKARPNDPFLLNRLAEINIAMGRKADALSNYNVLAQVYLGQNQPREAVAAFRSLLELEPGRRDARERLVELYKTMGDRPAAITELVSLSRLALDGPPEDLAGAVKYAEAAFTLDANHREAREWLYRLRRRQAEAAGTTFDEKTLRLSGADRQQQMDARELNEMLALAMSYQERGQYAAALKQYEAAMSAGLRTPNVYYNLGLLYRQAGQPAEAVERFRQAAQDPEFGMSSQYAMGLCYRDLGQMPEATQAFEAALHMLDLQSITKAEANDLIELYEAAARAHEAVGNVARAASLYTTLLNFLQTRRWRTGHTAEIKQHADDLTDQSMRANLRRIGGEEAPPPPPPAGPKLRRLGEAENAAPRPGSTPVPTPAEWERGAAPDPEAPTIYMRPNPLAATLGRSSSGMLRPITDFLRATPPTPAPSAPAPAPEDGGRGGANPPSLPRANEALLAAVAAAPLPPAAPMPRTIRPISAAAAGDGAPVGVGVPYSPTGAASVPSYTGNPVLDQIVEQAISDSDGYMAEGQLFAATDACLEVIQLAPDFLPIHLRLAEIYRLRGRPEDAAAKLQTVIDLYLTRGEHDLAAQVYPALVSLQPQDSHLRTKFAALLVDLGRRDAAVAEYLNLADMLFETGQADRALDELRRVRSLAPQNPEVRLRQGNYLLQMGRVQDALAEFSRALQQDPDNVLALARVYVTLVLLDKETQWDALQTVLAQAHASGTGREIIGEEIQAQAEHTGRPALYYALGLIYELEQPEEGSAPEEVEEFAGLRLKAMREAFERGVELLHPGERGALTVVLYWRTAETALAQGEGETAVRYYEEVMRLIDDPALEPSPRPTLEFIKPPTRVQVYQPLADAYTLQGDHTSAIEALQTAKTHLPYNRAIYTKLAELYFRKGQLGAALVAMEELVNHYQETFQFDKMLEALGQMARLAPNNIAVRRKLADIYLKRGMIDQGLSELELLSNLLRKDGMIKDAVIALQRAADIYLTMAQFPAALDIYDRILRMAPGDVDVRQQLITLYIQAGRLADAIREQKALAEICLAQNMTQAAIAALHQLIALAPQDPEGYYALAELLASQGEYGQAARLYARLQRLEPNNTRLPGLQAEMQRLAQEQAAVKP